MPLTCVNCRVAFESSESHRLHFKSEWHKYNLKRKLAELPVVSYQDFLARAAAYKQENEIPEGTLTCKPCHKNFSTENALNTHLKSKKHLEICSKVSPSKVELPRNAEQPHPQRKFQPSTEVINPVLEHSEESDGDISEEADDDDDWESIDDDDEEFPAVPTNICFFCSLESGDTESNLKHMKIVHSFYIPDTEYLIDQGGLLCYLGRKVIYGFTCLYCNFEKRSLKSVQQHMIDKCHCKMLFEGVAAMEEYEDFYDYSSSYPDHSRHENEEVDLDVLETDGYQLVLPSGATIGHRSLAMYYRQNLPPVRAVTTRKTDKLMSSFRALCQSSVGKLPYYKTNSYKYAMQRQRRSYLKLGMKQNKFQPHFRTQIMF